MGQERPPLELETRVFDSELDQTNELKIGIHSFSAWCSALKEQCGEQAGKFTSWGVGKGT